MNYIIVQAGGRGSRMESLTRNKPKALVPVDNLPMIFNLFNQFPGKEFIIIGDYKIDVLERYLRQFANACYHMVSGKGHKGTCAGLADAIDRIPEGERLMLVWCDLVLPKDYRIPDTERDVIGISDSFPCRWSYSEGKFREERSCKNGVAGLFVFRDKSCLKDVPMDGEFVRWLQTQGCLFEEQVLHQAHEYGLYSAWDSLPKPKTRPFNRMEEREGKLCKIPVDAQGKRLAAWEQNWYRALNGRRFRNLPEIFGYDPLLMEKIDGKNIYEYPDLPFEKKKEILKKIIESLKEVHKAGWAEADEESYRCAYLDKTYDRLKKVRYLVPFANDRTVHINGRECRNVFYHKDELERMVMAYMPDRFCLIHGDCTFSNIMLKADGTPVLIDPRGYFGNTELYGDAAYDWVKLYYSIVSNYDQFNLKRFELYINEGDSEMVCEDRGNAVSVGPGSVKLEIASSHWEALEDDFFGLLGGEATRRQMRLFLALTWLSLTTYAWNDYDSICGAFYNGLYYLEEALSMSGEDDAAPPVPPDSAYERYFRRNAAYIDSALKSVKEEEMDALVGACMAALQGGHKVIASGLGKNVPICEKFVGTMLSLGLNAAFMHTNTAVHGDMGMVHAGDLVIILTKSGSTAESVYLAELLKRREGVGLWLLSFYEHSELADSMEHKLIAALEHEGDPWNVVPNNSTVVNLLVLQELAMELARRLGVDLERDFKPNHPGGAIGARLRGAADICGSGQKGSSPKTGCGTVGRA